MPEYFTTLVYEIFLELLIASAIIWLLVILFNRLLKIHSPSWMVRFSVLPVILPALSIPLIHVLIRPNLLRLPHTPIEEMLVGFFQSLPVLGTIITAVGSLILLYATGYLIHPLAAIIRCRRDWNSQEKDSKMWRRCKRIADSASVKLQINQTRIIMTESGGCGSYAFGPMDSYIILPKPWALEMDDEELESLVTHELGHIKRKDSISGIFVGICHRLMILSPFSILAYRKYSQAREEAVDDLTVQTNAQPLSLASCLVKATRLSKGQKYPVASTGFLSSTKSVEQRIKRLLDESPTTAVLPNKYLWPFVGFITLISTVLLILL